MLDEVSLELNDSMEKTMKKLHNQLSKVRTGRAAASILDGLTVDYYGAPTPINQLGQISTPEARLLQIQPFDKTQIGSIEKTIIDANLGVTPSNDGNLIRIPFPALTEEKRKLIVKEVKKIGEDVKIVLRNLRRDQNDRVKKAEKAKEITEDDVKRIQAEVQKITDSFVAKVDKIIGSKEEEVMAV